VKAYQHLGLTPPADSGPADTQQRWV